MRLTSYEEAEAFLDVALPVLLRDEERNNLIVGIATQVREGRQYGEESPLFLTVDDDGEIVAAAIRTPPYNMILHCEEAHFGALDVIADYLIDAAHMLPGANGTVQVAEAFAKIWHERTGQSTAVLMSQRIYSLIEVVWPESVPGQMRWAREEDLPTLMEWFLGFCEEAVPNDPPENPEKNIRRVIDKGNLAIWENGGMVSMAGNARETPHGATIGPVYTPPEHRGHGYASACVAAVSQALLDRGKRFCALYTDLSNPTSNKIYQNVGYRPIVDCAMYTFGSCAK